MAGDGLGRLARRLIKATKDELLATTDRGREGAEGEQQRATADLQREAMLQAMPGVGDTLDRAEGRRAEEAAARAAAEEAALRGRPAAGVALSVTGKVTGSWSGALPCAVTGPSEAVPDLKVELMPLPGEAPTIGGQVFEGWLFFVPRWHGAGRYDLAPIVRELEAAGQAPDPVDYGLALGYGWDEPYTWHPDAGAGLVEVDPDGRTLHLRLAMDSAGGSVEVTATVVLPA